MTTHNSVQTTRKFALWIAFNPNIAYISDVSQFSSGHVQIWDIDGWCEEGRKMRCSMDDDHDTLAQHPFFLRYSQKL